MSVAIQLFALIAISVTSNHKIDLATTPQTPTTGQTISGEQQKGITNYNFQQYEGQDVKGAAVKSLIDELISYNNQNETKIKLTGNVLGTNENGTIESEQDLTNIKKAISTSKSYFIQVQNNDQNQIESIKVNQNY